jgi:hypothetical protein
MVKRWDKKVPTSFSSSTTSRWITQSAPFLFFLQRKPQEESAPLPWCAQDVNFAAMIFRDAKAHRQAQTCTFFSVFSGMKGMEYEG